MFRIECFVDDKHLPKVLKAMAGMTYNMKVDPVVNAMVDKKQVKAAGDHKPAYIRVYERLIHNGKSIGDRVLSIEVKDAMKEIKVSENSYSATVKGLTDKGLLKAVARGQFSLQESAA
jgi:hypothetical protein